MNDLIDVTEQYLRLVSIRFHPDSLDAAMEYFRSVSCPLVRRQRGSMGIIGAGSRTSGSTYSVSLWQSQEDLEHSNAVPEVVEAMAGYAEWMAGHFVVESFRVVSGSWIGTTADHPGAIHCRVVVANAAAGQLPAAIDAFTARLAQVQEMSRQCLGTLLLEPLVGAKIVAIEYWLGDTALVASEARVNTLDQRLHRHGLFQAPITRDIVEVFVAT